MKIELDKRFKKNVGGKFGKYSFEVGVLEDKPHRLPLRGARGNKGLDVLGTYAGGPIRKASRKASGQTISEVSKSLRENLGVNYLTEPFKKKSSDIMRFSREFFKLALGRSEQRRSETLLQAIVRNPMLRGDYGPNSELTKKIKGFDRKTIDTGQLFKNIKARSKVRRGIFG